MEQWEYTQKFSANVFVLEWKDVSQKQWQVQQRSEV